MLRKNIPFLLRFFFVLLVACGANAQIYLHNFGTTTISTHPYTVAPATLNTNLSNSSWVNSTGSWSSNSGATGQALQIFTLAGTTTAMLTFNVAPDFQANILSFSFWSRRSNSGPANWQLSINGTVAGSGTVTTAGALTGLINATGDFSGLTGTVTVELTLSNATGGNIRIDDFALFGSVISTCPVTVTSFSPSSAPAGTIVTINGTGFTGTSAVKFNNITSPFFTVISDTVLKAEVPAGNSDGTIVVTSGCMAYSAIALTLLETECAAGTDVFISEIYDAQAGSPGAIELYNPTPSTINFSGQYVLERYGTIGDGSPTSGYVLTLSGSIGPGQTYLVNSGPAPCGITPVSQLGNGINASDEIKLKKNGTVIDVVQAIGEVGYTFIRKPNANVPSPVYNSNHWNISNNESCSNLGVHTINSAIAPTVTNPADQATCQNGTATFTVTVTPATGAAYQWKIFNGTAWVNVANGPNYSEATSGTLIISNIPLSFDNNQYYCQVTTSSCTIVSSAVQLSVAPAAAEPQLDIQQPDCITTTTGTVTITSPIGTGYTYSINGGTFQSDTTFSSLVPDIYTITAKDPSGCSSLPADVIINAVPLAPATAITNVTHPTCTIPTGSITITNPVGTGLTYSLDGGIYQSSLTFNNVSSGNHTITVKNAGGCTSAPAPVIVNPVPLAPVAAIANIMHPTCTTSTGSITITNPVGAGLAYSLDGGAYQSSVIFTNIASGNHTITVQNTDGCISVPAAIIVDPVLLTPAQPTTNVMQTTCSNTTATITVLSPSGAGFSYSLDGGAYQSSATFNNVSTGNHTVTAQNPDGCTSTPATVIVNPVPSVPVAATVSIIHPTCSASTGNVTITAPTGTGLTYSLDGGTYQSSTTFVDVISGNHTLLVQNAEGCISAPATVIVNPVPSLPAAATANVVHPICTTPTGSITMTSPLGAGLTYSLDGGTYQSSPIFNNVTPGNHTVTVQNTDGCLSIPATVTVNPVPATPSPAIAAVTQPTCATPTGTITISSPIGAGLTYSLDGGAYQSTVTFNDITPGNHIITVQNADGCISSPATITVNAVPSIPAAALATITHPTCSATTGSITITSPLGTGLTYSLDGSPYQSSPTFSNIAAGNHSITVQGASGCISAPATFTVDPVPSAPAAATTNVIHPTCTVATGNIIIANPLGIGLSYSLNGGAYQSSATFNNVAAGNHIITVKNADGCISSPATVTVNPAPSTPAAAIANIIHPTCATPAGTITITSPVGAGLTYSLDDSIYQSSVTFSDVAPGNHIITVQNQQGCVSAPVNVVVNPLPSAPVAATVNIAPPTCEISTGSITITNPVGTGLTYSLDGGAYQSSNTFSNIAPGAHSIIVQGAAGCISVPATFNIDAVPSVPAAPIANIDNPTCTVATGIITITSPLGAGLTYSLDGGAYQASVTFSNITSGSHIITVQNAGGCTSQPITVIVNPVSSIPASPVVSAVQPTCSVTTGKITVSSPTGVDYQYSIDGINYQNITTFSNLAPGTYAITVRNTAGCTSVSSAITINNPPTSAPDPGTIVGSGEICLGDTTILSNFVTGGIWTSSNNAVATIDANGVVIGVSAGIAVIRYTVGATCTDWAEITIRVNPLPNPVLYDTYLCKDPATGGYPSILLNSGLSSAQYSFVWKKGATVLPDTQGYLSVFEPGTYNVTATSLITGCTSQTVSATVGVSSIATATAEVRNDFDYRQSINVIVTGGSGSYVYSLDGGPFQTSPVFTDIYEGEYTITVNDINGCGTTTFTVFALNYPRYFSPNDDGYHDFWNIDGLRGQRNAHIHIFDRYGKVVASIKPSGIGWDGTYNGNRLPATDYWFTVYYTSSNGQQKEFRAHFSLIR